MDSKREGSGQEVWLNGERYVGEYKVVSLLELFGKFFC